MYSRYASRSDDFTCLYCIIKLNLRLLQKQNYNNSLYSIMKLASFLSTYLFLLLDSTKNIISLLIEKMSEKCIGYVSTAE